MKTIVITGATRGIGYGLALEFLKRNHNVVISGRTKEAVDRAIAALKSASGSDTIFGIACDVRILEQVHSLWEASAERFGTVDIWINNAGIGHGVINSWEVPIERVKAVFDTNILGTYHGCRVAIGKMIEQGHGAIYNMEGYGSDGKTRMGLSIYGSSKSAIRFLSDSLIKELKESTVILGTLQPGMVATDMVQGQYDGKQEEWDRAKKIFNIFVETVEDVSTPLVKKILANTKSGTQIRAFPKSKVFFRFLSAPFSSREVFK